MKRECVILIGMAGAGKSTIGAALAEVLGFEFVDLDEYIRRKEGRGIQEIIDLQGDEALLTLEERYLREIGLKQRVVAPGGSIIYISGLMQYLKLNSVLVYLEDTFENLEKRLVNASTRGIVGWKTRTLREIYEERKPLYKGYADLTIDVSGKTPESVTGEIAVILAGLR